MDYAKNLKLARKWARLTQAELAKKAGIATITVRQYEAGNRKPTMDNWFAIADALHLSLDELNGAELLPTGPFDPKTILEESERAEKEDKRALEGILIKSFSQLNLTGQQEAVKRVEELTEIPRYQAGRPRQETGKPTPAPPEGKDTTPPGPGLESAEKGG